MNYKIPREILAECYSNNMSQKQIAEDYGLTSNYVSYLTCLYGLKPFKPLRVSKYPANDNFFKSWSPEMAYILGFILCDGNICNGSLSVEINRKDIEILEFIKKNLCPSRPLYHRDRLDKRTGNTYFTSSFMMGNQTIIKDLAELGIIPAKGGREIYPNIPEEFKFDFFRGVLDGDGSILEKEITINSKSYKSFCIQIASASIEFLEKLKENVTKCGSILRGSTNYYTLNISNREDVGRILNLTYNGGFCLKRKYEKYQKFLQLCEDMSGNAISQGTMKGIKLKKQREQASKLEV
jgi:hypothetical protein